MAALAKWLAGLGAFVLAFLGSGFLFGPRGSLELSAGQLGPALVLFVLAAALGWWSLRSRASTLSSFGRVSLKLVGTLLLLFGVVELLGISLAFGFEDGLFSSLPFLLAGTALWAYALRATPEIPPMRLPVPAPFPAGAAAAPPSISPADVERLDRLARQVDGETHTAFDRFWDQSLRLSIALTIGALAAPIFFGLLTLSEKPAEALGVALAGLLPLALLIVAIWVLQLFTIEGLRRELDAGRFPTDFRTGYPIRNFLRQWRERRTGRPLATPPTPGPGLAIGRILDGLRFGRKVTGWSRSWAVLTVILGSLVAAGTAYIATFSLLLRYAGGYALLPRDGGVATLVALGIACVAFPLLYRAYRRIDRVERRFVDLERALADLEQAFWARY
jgi:hypothetical protein